MFIREGKTWELFDLGGEGGDQCHHGSDSHFWGWGEGSPPRILDNLAPLLEFF